ncbi:DUF3710 domain-containing protein [Streptomyces sp. NPDC051662]|uniref:DUF3710 domain-containing protein n=1 Tax=Streptomyces sp. NPDC051662 TaxID=3154750 RepID=UPI003413392E
MRDVRNEAKGIIGEFNRNGSIAPDRVVSAEFGTWDRVTPAWVILAALKSVLWLRWDSGRSPDDQAAEAAELAPRLEQRQITHMIEAMLGDIAAVHEAQSRGLITLENLVGLMAVVVQQESMTEEELDAILEYAENNCREVLRTGDPWHPARRGIHVGPWDSGENVPGGERIDLGGMRIPSEPGLRIEPMRDGDEILAVTVIKGPTAIQLQAYRATQGRSWDVIRGNMMKKMKAQGTAVVEWAGMAGVELRVSVPVIEPDGNRSVQGVRVLGADGPGWILRGFVTGDGAEPDSRDHWAYEMFMETVVSPFHSTSPDDSVIGLRRPHSGI